MGQRLTGNRGYFFSSELREKGGGRVGASEPRKGPRANLKDGDSYHTTGSKTGDASSLPFPIGYTMWGPGARRN